MAESGSIHIRHFVTPSLIEDVFQVLSVYPDADIDAGMQELATGMGLSIGDFKAKSFGDVAEIMRKMGLLHKARPTQVCMQLVSLTRRNRKLLPELLHYSLFSGAWSNRDAGLHWGYRQVCNLLWQAAPVGIDRRHVASQVIEMAVDQLGYRPAFSSDSVSGVVNWIRDLEPSVLSENKTTEFHRRSFCPPELLLLGIDDLYKRLGVGYSSNLPLTTETRDWLHNLCLIEPDSFERVLSWCTAQFDGLSTGVSSSGPYVLLSEPIDLSTLQC